jgi:organic hydroperoxide reductase OsmC/OhrA
METTLPLLYNTDVEWTREREGVLRSWPLPPLQIAAPPEFSGKEGIWTPEHLYVAAVNSCFVTTFLAVAENSKLRFRTFDCAARGRLESVPGWGYQITEIKLYPRLELTSVGDVEKAARIIEKAKRNCLISNSIITEVIVEPSIFSTKDPQLQTGAPVDSDPPASRDVNGAT